MSQANPAAERADTTPPPGSAVPARGLYIPSLDGIRAISFFIVFLSHVGLGSVVPGGFGVTIFFLLSGFLITTLLRGEFARHSRIDLGGFYLRRVLRILPPLYIVLGLAVLLYFVQPMQPTFPVSGTVAQGLQVSNYFLIFNDGVDIILPGTGLFWSLAVEEHFYFIFPLLYLWMAPRFSVRGQALILGALCAAALAWRCVLMIHFDASPLRTYYATDTRFDSILLGCAFAIIANPVYGDTGFRWVVKHLAWLIPLCVIVLVGTLVWRSAVFRETARYTLQGLALVPLFIAAIHHHRSAPARLLNLPLVRFLGVLSYTLYLCHVIFIESVTAALGANPAINAIVALAFALGFATLVHYGVERPLARIRKRLHGS